MTKQEEIIRAVIMVVVIVWAILLVHVWEVF